MQNETVYVGKEASIAKTKVGKSNNHLAYLDGVRGVSALYVVLHHAMFQVFHPEEKHSGIAEAICIFFSYGHYAVTMFIILSLLQKF